MTYPITSSTRFTTTLIVALSMVALLALGGYIGAAVTDSHWQRATGFTDVREAQEKRGAMSSALSDATLALDVCREQLGDAQEAIKGYELQNAKDDEWRREHADEVPVTRDYIGRGEGTALAGGVD